MPKKPYNYTDDIDTPLTANEPALAYAYAENSRTLATDFDACIDDDDCPDLTERELEALSRHFEEISAGRPILSDEEALRSAITIDELLVGIHEDIRKKFASRV